MFVSPHYSSFTLTLQFMFCLLLFTNAWHRVIEVLFTESVRLSSLFLWYHWFPREDVFSPNFPSQVNLEFIPYLRRKFSIKQNWEERESGNLTLAGLLMALNPNFYLILYLSLSSLYFSTLTFSDNSTHKWLCCSLILKNKHLCFQPKFFIQFFEIHSTWKCWNPRFIGTVWCSIKITGIGDKIIWT